MNDLNKESFQYGNLNLCIREKPVSSQNNKAKKKHLKARIQSETSLSKYIITSRCWVHIEYNSSNFTIYKNPGLYDLDNIIKPKIDSLIGLKGIILDDSLFERVGVNWVDTPHDDHLEIKIEYPDTLFVSKTDLLIVKSKNGWCFPTSKLMIKHNRNSIINAFKIWDNVKNEDDYYQYLGALPIQEFVHYSKIKDKGYRFIELGDI